MISVIFVHWASTSLCSSAQFICWHKSVQQANVTSQIKVSVHVAQLRESSESVANDSAWLRFESSGNSPEWRLLALSSRHRRRSGLDWLIGNEKPSVTTFPAEYFFLCILFTIFSLRQITLYSFGKKIGKSTAEAASGWLNLTALPRTKFCSSMVQTMDKTMRCNVAAK